MTNKKILIFTNHFLPGNRAGGPVTSIANLTSMLNTNFDITIITSNKDLGEAIPYDNVAYDKAVRFQKFNVVYLSVINATSILNIINNINPNIVYLNSFFSTFTQIVLWLRFTNKLKSPIALAPRGEFQENALAIKPFKKNIYLVLYRALRLYKKVYFHVTDKIEYDSAKKLLPIDNISILPNVPKGINETPLHKNKAELKLIFISRIRDNKNLLIAIKALAVCPGHIIFDIYGPIEDKTYWNTCLIALNKLPKNIKTEYKGVVKPAEVSTVMRKYHALILPTKTENFGHVIVEAMQSGVIPIISDKTPWVNLYKNNAGWDIALSDINEFTKVIDLLYNMENKAYSLLSKNTITYIGAKLNIDELKKKYEVFFHKIITTNK